MALAYRAASINFPHSNAMFSYLMTVSIFQILFLRFSRPKPEENRNKFQRNHRNRFSSLAESTKNIFRSGFYFFVLSPRLAAMKFSFSRSHLALFHLVDVLTRFDVKKHFLMSPKRFIHSFVRFGPDDDDDDELSASESVH